MCYDLCVAVRWCCLLLFVVKVCRMLLLLAAGIGVAAVAVVGSGGCPLLYVIVWC